MFLKIFISALIFCKYPSHQSIDCNATIEGALLHFRYQTKFLSDGLFWITYFCSDPNVDFYYNNNDFICEIRKFNTISRNLGYANISVDEYYVYRNETIKLKGLYSFECHSGGRVYINFNSMPSLKTCNYDTFPVQFSYSIINGDDFEIMILKHKSEDFISVLTRLDSNVNASLTFKAFIKSLSKYVNITGFKHFDVDIKTCLNLFQDRANSASILIKVIAPYLVLIFLNVL